MRILDILTPGGPEALVLADAPTPTIGSEEVLIEVAAAGLNRADLLQRKGRYPPPPGAPRHPGLEVAGRIVQLGSAVRDLKEGDAVCALISGGGYAEYCAVHAGQVLPIPRGLDMVQAASLPEAYFTVWSNVFGFGRLQQGETLLVHGGSSGIGTAAIQLAIARGHIVFTTVGSEEKQRFCEALGAKRSINYNDEDFVAVVAQASGGRGVDVILDMIGGPYVDRNLQALAPEGRLVMIATQGGLKGEINVLPILQRRLVITGSLLRPRSNEFKQSVRDQVLEHVWPLIERGAIRPVVDKVFDFTDASQAHAYMEQGVHKGKIILRVRD